MSEDLNEPARVTKLELSFPDADDSTPAEPPPHATEAGAGNTVNDAMETIRGSEASQTVETVETVETSEGGKAIEAIETIETSETIEVERPVTRDRSIARKEYYSISEVCDLVDLKPHVLRYWETQFPLLNPSKNRSGNRVYQRKEIKLILLVKTLLYEEKYTVEGAKKKLDQLRRGGELNTATKGALDKQMVALLRAEMHTLTELLTPPRPQA